METKYPDRVTYEALYAKYLERGVDEIVGALPKIAGASVLDLCGGNGRLSRKLLERDAAVVRMVDREQSMAPRDLVLGEPRFVFICDDVPDYFERMSRYAPESHEYAVCQQAINYWLTSLTAKHIAAVLKSDGLFVFNTFNEKPSETPQVKQYVHEGHSFVETAWCIGNIVHHVQIRDGMTPHYTMFYWIPPEQYRRILEPYFVVEEKRNERSSLYTCTKK